MGVEDLLTKDPVYLDTNIFIYALEDFPEYTVPIKKIFEAIDQGEVKAYTSDFTLAEVLVKPFALKNKTLVSLYKDFIQDSNVLSVQSVTRQIFIHAARIRAFSDSHISLADAIHLATANTVRCRTFLTNDRRLLRQDVVNLEIILLADL